MYQITYITKEEKNDSIKKAIELLNGKVVKEESLGRKKFCYMIKKEGAGFYHNLVFEIDGKQLGNLGKKLHLNEDILRFLIITKKLKIRKKIEEKPEVKEIKVEKVAKPVTKLVKEEKPIEAKKDKKKSAEEEKLLVKPESAQKVITTTPITKPQKETISEDERLAKLEEKLDELLKE